MQKLVCVDSQGLAQCEVLSVLADCMLTSFENRFCVICRENNIRNIIFMLLEIASYFLIHSLSFVIEHGVNK